MVLAAVLNSEGFPNAQGAALTFPVQGSVRKFGSKVISGLEFYFPVSVRRIRQQSGPSFLHVLVVLQGCTANRGKEF